MSNKLIDALKPIKYIGNTFGFIPFCLDKEQKNYQKIDILNYCYLLVLIVFMSFCMYFNITITITWFRDASFMPEIVHQFIQALPMTVSIIHALGPLLHGQEYCQLVQKFNKIDQKVVKHQLVSICALLCPFIVHLY